MSCAFPIETDLLVDAWPMVKPYLEAALEHADGKYDLSVIFEQIQRENYKLWVVYNESQVIGCFVTELVQYPCAKILDIPFLSCENFDTDIAPHLDAVKQWARDHNAVSIEFFGRAGWEKKLKPVGFEKTHTVMRLKL